MEIKLNGATTDTYTYNAAGAMLTHAVILSGSEEAFTYDMWDRLSTYTNASGATTTYKYDVNGLRTAKITGNTTTQYVVDKNNNVIAEADGNGTATAQTIWGDKPLSRKEDNNYFYYLYNAHGDVIGLTNESGTVINNYSFNAWGNILSQSEQVTQPIKYAGEYYDTESGNIYLRARYYDPKVGRFTSLDPLQGSVSAPSTLNRYVFCANNPIMFSDPTGCMNYWTQSHLLAGGYIQRTWEIVSQFNLSNYNFINSIKGGITFWQGVGSLAKTIYNGNWSEFKSLVSGYLTDAVMGDILYLKNNYTQFKTDVDITNDQAWELGRRTVGAIWEIEKAGFTVYSFAGSISKILAAKANGTFVKAAGLGSTGRTAANNLKEKLAMDEVMSKPGGKKLNITMTDSRWLASDGWVKMAQSVNGIEIHYLKNTITGAFDDFKFK